MTKTKGFRLPEKTARFLFEESEFTGAEVVARLTVPIGLLLEVQELAQSGNLGVYNRFGEAILQNWNLEDRKGNPLPANGEGMAQVTTEFANELIKQWLEAVANPPGPLAEPSTNGST